MEWIALVIGVVLYAFTAYCTYQDGFRNSNWFYPVFTIAMAATGLVFAIAVRWLDDKQRVYVFSLWWDSVLTMVYYLTPVLFFGVRFGKTAAVGIFLVVLGLLVLKFAGSE